MSAWDALTWAAIVVLGPGAVIVFAAFLRDARRILGQGRSDDHPPFGQ
jgi:hypothetical protein